MNSQRPLLVASEPTIAEQVRACLKDKSGQQVRVCSYDNYRDHVAWHKQGFVALLTTTGDEDATAAAKFVQEAKLRCSPLHLALVHVGDTSESLSSLDAYIACRAVWPQEAGGLIDSIRAIPSASSTNAESLADVLTSRLMLNTPSLLPQVGRLALAAAHDITVLLTGETGTGKTYLARLLHEHSPRRQHPFLMVPCGAQPSNLFESTFFGHVKGAYTGAHQSRIGRFAAAGKGTILLDEIDALGMEQQASLLRVIESGEYELVGGNETLHSEARIIVASNCDLAEEVAKDKFRLDLFYRLNVMSFHLAPLRKRRQDISLLARGIVARFNDKFGKDLFDIAEDALAALEAYHWPGNIRQLENVLQEAVLGSCGPVLALHDLPELPCHNLEPDQQLPAPALFTRPLNGQSNGQEHHPLPTDTLSNGRVAYERRLIQQTLVDCKFNRSRAARALGVSRVTLYKKMKQYSLTDLPHR